MITTGKYIKKYAEARGWKFVKFFGAKEDVDARGGVFTSINGREYNSDVDEYAYWITVPDEAEVIFNKDENEFVASQIFLDREWTEEEYLRYLYLNGSWFKYAPIQTPEICLEAVQTNPWALQFVEEQTREICLAAVEQNGYTLQFVEHQTSEICLAAIKDIPASLEYVKNITFELALDAMRRDSSVFLSIPIEMRRRIVTEI